MRRKQSGSLSCVGLSTRRRYSDRGVSQSAMAGRTEHSFHYADVNQVSGAETDSQPPVSVKYQSDNEACWTGCAWQAKDVRKRRGPAVMFRRACTKDELLVGAMCYSVRLAEACCVEGVLERAAQVPVSDAFHGCSKTIMSCYPDLELCYHGSARASLRAIADSSSQGPRPTRKLCAQPRSHAAG